MVSVGQETQWVGKRPCFVELVLLILSLSFGFLGVELGDGGADLFLERDRLDLGRVERRELRLRLAQFLKQLPASLQLEPADVRRPFAPSPAISV